MVQLGLSYVCFCLRHVSDDVYSTVTHAGRAVFAPNYPHHGRGSGRGTARSGVRPFGLVSSRSLPVLAADGKDLVSPSAFPARALEVEISPRGGQDLAKMGSGLKVLSRKMSGYSFKRGRSRKDVARHRERGGVHQTLSRAPGAYCAAGGVPNAPALG